MAKQSGIHQLKGKIRGMSYYRQKGVVDGLARSINQGLSKRVKEDVAYANTRLNATEFGRAGSFAGAAIRAISERQRTMLKDFATGNFAKQVRDIIISDPESKWGNRQLVGNNWQNMLKEIISTYAKVDFASNTNGVFDATVSGSGNSYTWKVNTNLPEGWGTQLSAKGATGAIIDLYAYRVSLDELSPGILKGSSSTALISSINVVIGVESETPDQVTLPSEFGNTEGDNKLIALLVVVRPYQKVNEGEYIRQELCTFCVKPFTVGQ